MGLTIKIIKEIQKHGKEVVIQWVLNHIGTKDNEHVNTLCQY